MQKNIFRTTVWPDVKQPYFEQQDKKDVHGSVDANYSASQSRPSRYENMGKGET